MRHIAARRRMSKLDRLTGPALPRVIEVATGETTEAAVERFVAIHGRAPSSCIIVPTRATEEELPEYEAAWAEQQRRLIAAAKSQPKKNPMDNVTPGYALSGMPEAATDFIQGIERPTQLTAWTGNAEPFKDDPTVYNAIKAGHEALLDGASKIRALSGDLTRNEPQRHEAGGEVSAKTVAKLEETQRIVQAQANAYQAGGDEALNQAFPIKDSDKWLYDRWLSFVDREAANQNGGHTNIRKATLANRELATVLMKMPAELIGLPGDFLQTLRVKAVEKFHPEIQEAWQRAEDLRDIAGKFTSLIGRTKLNFHSPLVARRMATRVNV